MAVRVELIDEAVVDLADQAESGMLRPFFKKLLEIEEHGVAAGAPLGKNLVGWRKLTVGNRDWRIVFRVNRENTVATICVIGDREDAACYEEAKRRAQRAKNADATSLAESMMDLFGTRKQRRTAKQKHKAAAR